MGTPVFRQGELALSSIQRRVDSVFERTLADIPTSQGFYEGVMFLDTQFRSPSWTRFPDHLWLLISLHCIVYLLLPPPKIIMSNSMYMH